MIAVDVPHHITHRGNNRQEVFLSDEDRRRYQDLLRRNLAACAVDLTGRSARIEESPKWALAPFSLFPFLLFS